MLLLTLADIKNMIQKIGIDRCFVELVEALRNDFSRWNSFQLNPRIATHFPHGVIELMPICGEDYYAYKYVNGHPYNPQQQKLNVVATGMLADVENGYPILLSEMTILTALRTAATCALATDYLARKNAKTVALIGTGSQAEFQVLALKAVRDITTVRYFDVDSKAMEKFSQNLSDASLELVACEDIPSTIQSADIIVTATADKRQARILEADWVEPGVHINGVGGDCPGKTELDPAILQRAKVVIEYLEQSKQEGEIQNVGNQTLDEIIYAELWELASQKKEGRQSDDEVTLFDSVGVALEDYTVLKYVYGLAQSMDIGQRIDIIPSLDDPKNLWKLLL